MVAEQLVVQPDVGEVVDRGEAQARPLRIALRRVDARIGERAPVPHGSEEVGELLVVPEVVGHDDLAPLALVGAALPPTAELDDDAAAARWGERHRRRGGVQSIGPGLGDRCELRRLGDRGRVRDAARRRPGASWRPVPHRRPRGRRTPAPSRPVRSWYAVTVLAEQSSAWFRCTSATTQPPKPAPVSRAPIAPCSTSEIDEQVELRDRDLVVVAQAGVTREQERAERVGVAACAAPPTKSRTRWFSVTT